MATKTRSGRASQALRNPRLALATFVVAEAVALPLWLVLGRDQWFFYDEWDFLAARSGTDLGDLLRPHAVHWSTLPILVYRGLWSLVGLRSYLPYQSLTVLLHLTVAALLLIVMRRAGVSPWVATAAATLFAFFGAGYENIIQAFQIGFDASLVFGLAHLLLADHDGPLDRRDALGLVAGLAGLLCSGVAVSMTIVVGIAVLLRRGWRTALVHTAPLGALYLAWAVRFGDSRKTSNGLTFGTETDFVVSNMRAMFGALGQVPGVGVALGALVVIGAGGMWVRPRGRVGLRARAAAPTALLVGALAFLVITGIGRAAPSFFQPTRQASRYIHVAAALTLPTLAVGADTLARRWRQLAPLVIALIVIGIPGNVNALANYMHSVAPFRRGFRQNMLLLPRSRTATQVPRWVRPLSVLAPDVTIGWLLDGTASGRIPHPGPSTPAQARTTRLRLSLAPDDRGRTSNRCRNLTTTETPTLENGDSIATRGPYIAYIYLHTPEGGSAPLVLGAPPYPQKVTVVVDTLTVMIVPLNAAGAMLCT